jgi:predicted transcriptional regulator
MGIIDEMVTIAGFDAETALPVASITTDDPDAREWAEELYRRYKREAEPLGAVAAEPSV